ncbi:MAG: hypothetical protein P9L92_16510 [Candidatus Electryonea clarkiae]|nr:hypothetical protein [Candidatus Electryonea clarkiae]MDP8285509.1 hypothetical protein [Candidatus Electryonea clarkiae]
MNNFQTKVLFSLVFLLALTEIIFADFPLPLVSKYKKWQVYDSATINSDDPNYPLEHIEDSYRLVRAYRTSKQKYGNGYVENAENLIDWRWKYEVRNKSDKLLYVTVTYKLVDKEGFLITSSVSSDYVKPFSTTIIKRESNMEFRNSKLLYSRHWSIGYEVR